MLSQKLRERTDTVSFRIGSSIRLSLEEEAQKSGITLNALVSQILSYHTGWGRYARMLKLIPTSKDHLREVYSFITKERIQNIARNMAETAGRETIMFLFQHIDISSVMDFIEIWGNHFDAYEHRYNGRIHSYTVRHDVNTNYSYFIKEFVTTLIENTIPRTVRFEHVGPNSVSFSFEA